MNAVDSRRIGQEQLQVCKQGEVIRGDVGMGAASDIVLVEPVGVQGTQHAQHIKQRLRVEDVVNDALEKKKERKTKTLQLCHWWFDTKIKHATNTLNIYNY